MQLLLKERSNTSSLLELAYRHVLMSYVIQIWCTTSPFNLVARFLCIMRRHYVPHFVTKEQGCLEMYLKSWCDSLFNESSENWMARAMWYETFIWYDKRLDLSFARSPFEIHWPIISELSFLFWLFWIVYDKLYSSLYGSIFSVSKALLVRSKYNLYVLRRNVLFFQ